MLASDNSVDLRSFLFPLKNIKFCELQIDICYMCQQMLVKYFVGLVETKLEYVYDDCNGILQMHTRVYVTLTTLLVIFLFEENCFF